MTAQLMLALLVLLLLLPAVVHTCVYKRSDACPDAWDYGNNDAGPSHWAASCVACGAPWQSPIAIEEGATLETPLPALLFQGAASAYTLRNRGTTLELEVADEGKPVMNLTGGALGSQVYHLTALHWHSPAEHLLPGMTERSPLELHLVHRDADGAYAVAAFQFHDAGETESPLIATLIPYFLQVAVPVANDSVRVNGTCINVYTYAEALFASQSFAYNGSTTTPPCIANVRWLVAALTASASSVQLAAMARVLHNNSRPVQALEGRVVVRAVRAHMSKATRSVGYVFLTVLVLLITAALVGSHVWHARNAPPMQVAEMELRTPVVVNRRSSRSHRRMAGLDEDPEESEESLTAVLAQTHR